MSSELATLANGNPAPVPEKAYPTGHSGWFSTTRSPAKRWPLTTGVFLAGYTVELGASNAEIGMLAAVPFAVQFLIAGGRSLWWSACATGVPSPLGSQGLVGCC